MMNKFNLLIFLILNLFMAGHLHPQDVDEMQQKLHAIQKEIMNLEKQLKTQNNRLKIETTSIENIDIQINLTHDKINIYRRKIGAQQVLVVRLENQIDSLQHNITNLQDIFSDQVVFAYKYQRGKQLDWILGASSFNEVVVKFQYFRKVTQAERSIFEDLIHSKTELDEKEARLTKEIAVTRQYLAAAKDEEGNLNSRRKTKSQLIDEIKQNKTLLSWSLKEKKQSYQEMKQILASLEKGRSNRQLKVDTRIKWEKLSGNFSKSKGKFNWPVEGQILHNFGRFKNPELKTVLDNPGIDIQASRGSLVRCIFPGVVSLIIYMSGFGNTVIIDHNDGYYTVYAHLDEVSVNSGDFVEVGSQIALVGESGSLEGPKLHFEIYGNNQTLNPLLWLKNK